MAKTLNTRTAIIDLGTNTFNLLIAEKSESCYQPIFKTKIPVNLGKGGFHKNILSEDAFDRGLKALATHKNTINAYKATSTHAFATSAVRSASNGKEFAEKAMSLTGIKINIISGDYEAELIYKGVTQALKLKEKNSLIMDIGGGSTEFIIANKNGIQWKHSFDLGVSRLLAKNTFSDPISTEEVSSLQNFLDRELVTLLNACQKYPVNELIGSSGSFESISDIIDAAEEKDKELKKETEVVFGYEQLCKVIQQIITSTKEERENLNGLVPFRINTIVMASIIIHHIMEAYSLKDIRLSRYALREGVLGLIFDNM